MKIGYKFLLGFILLFAIGVASVLYSLQEPTGLVLQEQMTMKVGYLPVVVNLPLFVALENGYFEKYNLQLNAIEAENPNHIVEALVSGNLDGAGVLAYPILFVAEARYPSSIKIFNSGDETENNYVASIIVRNDSKIYSIEDMKGKKVGVYTGLVQVLFLKGIMRGAGLDPEKDIEIIQIAPNMQLQGLQAGQYDALSTVEPFTTIAESKGIGKILVKNPRVIYIQNPFPSVATPLSKKFIEQNPEAAQAYILAMNDAVDFIRKNPSESKKFLAKYTPVSEQYAQKVVLPVFNKFGEEDRNAIQKNADWFFENKLLEKKVNVNDMFGNSSYFVGS
ncbi:ABC transporter substrate-binding protein [Candidatus Woesearchaeota archaeon]|nr:ABC transporter substrate-binding protein [Candidatus Woesearchaeota archaeon]